MPSKRTTEAYRTPFNPFKKQTPSEKFIHRHFVDARCVMVDNTYLGKTTRWYVIYIYAGRHIEDLGASRKSEMLAWRNSVKWAKERIAKNVLEKFES
jgi:hypothetical protein